MTGKDLLSIMSEVDDDLILKTEIRPQPTVSKVSYKRWIGVVAGICALILAVFGIVQLIDYVYYITSPTSGTTTTPHRVETTTTAPQWTDPTEPPTVYPDENSIIYCPDSSGRLSDSEDVIPGQVIMPEGLEESVSRTADWDKYYSVTIKISTFIDKEDIQNEIESELERLINLGCFLELVETDPSSNRHNDFTLKGVVTGSLLSSFQTYDHYGYSISWNHK